MYLFFNFFMLFIFFIFVHFIFVLLLKQYIFVIYCGQKSRQDVFHSALNCAKFSSAFLWTLFWVSRQKISKHNDLMVGTVFFIQKWKRSTNYFRLWKWQSVESKPENIQMQKQINEKKIKILNNLICMSHKIIYI